MEANGLRTDNDLESIAVTMPLSLVGRSTTKIEVKIYFNKEKDSKADIQNKLVDMLEAGKNALEGERIGKK